MQYALDDINSGSTLLKINKIRPDYILTDFVHDIIIREVPFKIEDLEPELIEADINDYDKLVLFTISENNVDNLYLLNYCSYSSHMILYGKLVDINDLKNVGGNQNTSVTKFVRITNNSSISYYNIKWNDKK